MTIRNDGGTLRVHLSDPRDGGHEIAIPGYVPAAGDYLLLEPQRVGDPQSRVGYGPNLRFVVAVRRANGTLIALNDTATIEGAADAFFRDGYVIPAGTGISSLMVAVYTGDFFLHSTLRGLLDDGDTFPTDGSAQADVWGLRKMAAASSRFVFSEEIDFTALFVGGESITTLLANAGGGENGGGLTQALADARYRLKATKLTTAAYADESITEAKLHADVQAALVADYGADDARKLYAVSGAGNSVGWDTLAEIYGANEFFAAAKPAGTTRHFTRIGWRMLGVR